MASHVVSDDHAIIRIHKTIEWQRSRTAYGCDECSYLKKMEFLKHTLKNYEGTISSSVKRA